MKLFKRTAIGMAYLFSVIFISACGTTGMNTAKSSRDFPDSDYLSSLIKASESPEEDGQQFASLNRYEPLRGHMDHVEYYINQDLMRNGLAPEGSAKNGGIPELKSAFDVSKGWLPKKGFNIPVAENAAVDRWIHYFTGPLRPHYTRWLSRASMYAPLMESILKEYDVPTDLIYLSMIESGFNLNAYSSAAATGPWQFIKSTGAMYGLTSDGYVDERRDLVKATRAAASHLRDLHNQFGDWYLAFAAYNAGAGGVSNAIRKAGTKDFWKLANSKYLHQETKDYVPRILAAAIIAKNYKKYGFSSDLFQRPLSYDTASVSDTTDINVVALCAGVPVEKIKALNPALVMGITPPGRSYTLMLPKGTSDLFKNNYARVPKSDRVLFATHIVKKKESLASIASRYGVSRDQLASANSMSSKAQPKVGSKLVIPKTSHSLDRMMAKMESRSKKDIQVAKLDTPGVDSDGAENYSEPQGDDQADNQGNQASNDSVVAGASPKSLDSDDAPKVVSHDAAISSPDTTAALTQPPSVTEKTFAEAAPISSSSDATYTVKRGDTLTGIAKKFNVSLSYLKDWNNLDSGNVKVGQVLKIKQPLDLSNYVADASRPVLQQQSYKVIQGDTLSDIANKFNLSVDSIRAWNKMNPGQGIYPGQMLKMTPPLMAESGGAAQAQPVAQNPTPVVSPSAVKPVVKKEVVKVAAAPQKKEVTGKYVVHSVKQGETLWDLARKYRVSVTQLRQWNKLKNNAVFPNQKIKVFGAGTGKIAMLDD